MPLMIIALILNRIETAPVPFYLKPVTKKISVKAMEGYAGPNIKLNLEYLEASLQKSAWFCGDEMTGADILMSFPIEAVATRVDLADNYPALNEFQHRIRALPAYKRAIEKGGPYDY